MKTVERKAVTTDQLRAMLADLGVEVGKKAVIEWLVRGRVKGVKIGGRWYIPMTEVERLMRPFREPQGDGGAV